MAQFRYSALRDSGERVTGAIEGSSRSMVISRLSSQGLHPIDVADAGTASILIAKGDSRQRTHAAQELTVFTRQLAWLLQSGTPINRALDILGAETFSKRLAQTIVALRAAIRKGRSFHDALVEAGGFPAFYLSMVEVGEATGTLAAALDKLAGALERDQKIRAKAISALTYPLLLVVLAVGVVIFLMVSVVPSIKDMIMSSGAPVPASAQAVISVSDWLVANNLKFAVTAVSAAALLLLVWPRGWLQSGVHAAALRLPLLGDVLMKAEVAQFCRVLGALTAAGMSLPSSLKLISGTLANRRIVQAALDMETALRRGEDFIEPLRQSRIFPPILARMLKVGNETGNLTSSIHWVTDMLEQELDRMIERVLALLGPLIILALSVFVALIIVSLMSAVISINDLAM